MAKKRETGWAVAGTRGLYYGWWSSRVAAIQAHIDALYGYSERRIGLSYDQREAWKKCKRKGDRTVRVTISYQ